MGVIVDDGAVDAYTVKRMKEDLAVAQYNLYAMEEELENVYVCKRYLKEKANRVRDFAEFVLACVDDE